MVKIYDNIKDDKGIDSPNRVRLFISKVDENGEILESVASNYTVPMTNGTMFIVDNWLIDQLDKVVFKDGTLQVKDGEQLDEPVKSEIQLEEEELLERLAELQASKMKEKRGF